MKIKQIFTLVALSLSVMTINAQPGGGGGGMGGGGGQQGGGPGGQQQSISTDFVSAAGLFNIDLATVVKKCSIKDKALTDRVKGIVVEYQLELEKLEFAYRDEIELLRKYEKAAKKDQTSVRTNMRAIMEISQKIKEKSIPMHKRLSERMMLTLPEKELKKWMTYYQKVCEEYSFSTEARQQQERGGNSAGGRSGGMQGGGGMGGR